MPEQAMSREWKKDRAELLLLPPMQSVPRHGYEIEKPMAISGVTGVENA